MVGDFVAIEVPRETPREHGAAAVASCNAALGEGRCALAAAQETAEPRWEARIRWSGEGSTQLFVELRSGALGRLLAERQVSFSPHDAPRQRWASAGLVVASLVADGERQPEIPEPPPQGTREPTPAAQPAAIPVRTQKQATFLRLDGGMVLAPALEDERFRVGGFVRAGLALAPLPIAVHGSARASAAAGQPDIAVASGTAGFTVRMGRWSAPFGLELRAEGVAQQVRLTASDPASGQQEHATRARFGGSLALDLEWRFSRRCSLIAGADATLLRPEVVVDVLGAPRGRAPPVGWLASAGLRVRPGR